MVYLEMPRNYSKIYYPRSVSSLLNRYSNVSINEVWHPMDLDDFEKQKRKQGEYPIEGGAIGIIVTPENQLVLTKRSGPNKGWALPGGRVEVGEEFDQAFVREAKEETGLIVSIDMALVIEHKNFTLKEGQSIGFWLAVFKGHAISPGQPYETIEAQKEGLEIGVFTLDKLPNGMLVSDQQKINNFFNVHKIKEVFLN